MAGESIVQVNSGTGPKLHTWQRTIGANNVEDEVVLLGEPELPTYRLVAPGTSVATANSHNLQIMAGASLHVRIRRIRLLVVALPAANSLVSIELFRLTTAGTGGGAVTVSPVDTNDAAAGCTGMTAPTVKGTEGAALDLWRIPFPINTATVPAFEWVWEDNEREKPIIIPAGATNGLAFKSLTAVAAGTLDIIVTVSETSYL